MIVKKSMQKKYTKSVYIRSGFCISYFFHIRKRRRHAPISSPAARKMSVKEGALPSAPPRSYVGNKHNIGHIAAQILHNYYNFYCMPLDKLCTKGTILTKY